MNFFISVMATKAIGIDFGRDGGDFDWGTFHKMALNGIRAAKRCSC